MRSCEGIGKNIEQAIQNALLELKASREDVDIKILNEGGFLKKAKVLVSISEDAIEKYEKKEKFKEELKRQEVADEDFAENFIKRKLETVDMKESETTISQEDNIADSVSKVRIVADEEISETLDKKETKDVKRDERKFTGEEFLQGVLTSLNLEAEVEKSVDEKFERFNLQGEEVNDLIGHHGECMLALSHVMGLVCKTDDKKRIVLDVNNYRQKREESLTALAKRIADKVSKSGRYYKLEPMDASERKIIHTALQEDERVTTLSKGEEPHRYLIVFPKEYRDER